MARKHEAEILLRSGLSPTEIAKTMGISVGSAIQYLRTRLGEGALRRSDLYFAIPAARREYLQSLTGKGGIDKQLRENGSSPEEFVLFSNLRSRRVFAGDLYEFVCDIEIALHDLVRQTLRQVFGPSEEHWWRRGIPEEVRKGCVNRREEDDDPSPDPFTYTTLVNLYKIIDANWKCFVPVLPKEYRGNKSTLKRDFTRLNRIRNAVMHPVKQQKWSEADFLFVRTVRAHFVKGG
jgi:hypothetical protein